MKLPITLPFLIVCLVLASCVANKSADNKTPIEDNGNRNPFVITSETEYTVYQILQEPDTHTDRGEPQHSLGSL